MWEREEVKVDPRPLVLARWRSTLYSTASNSRFVHLHRSGTPARFPWRFLPWYEARFLPWYEAAGHSCSILVPSDITRTMPRTRYMVWYLYDITLCWYIPVTPSIHVPGTKYARQRLILLWRIKWLLPDDYKSTSSGGAELYTRQRWR